MTGNCGLLFFGQCQIIFANLNEYLPMQTCYIVDHLLSAKFFVFLSHKHGKLGLINWELSIFTFRVDELIKSLVES